MSECKCDKKCEKTIYSLQKEQKINLREIENLTLNYINMQRICTELRRQLNDEREKTAALERQIKRLSDQMRRHAV